MVKAGNQVRTTTRPTILYIETKKRPIRFSLSLKIHATALSSLLFVTHLDHVQLGLSAFELVYVGFHVDTFIEILTSLWK